MKLVNHILTIGFLVGMIFSWLIFRVIIDLNRAPESLSDDKGREDVASTCRFVAAIRYMDSNRDSVYKNMDPLSGHLAGEDTVNALHNQYSNIFDLDSDKNYLFAVAMRGLSIEDRLEKHSSEVEQIVVIGAGMNTSPYRVKLPNIDWFEVDMPEVLDLKESLIESVPEDLKEYTKIQVQSLTRVRLNLKGRIPELVPNLIENGFNPKKPTVYIMEGFIPYLTINEVKLIFDELPLVKNSRVIATVVRNSGRTVLTFPFIQFLLTKFNFTFHKIAELWQNDWLSLIIGDAFGNWKIVESINIAQEMKLKRQVVLPVTKHGFSARNTLEDIHDLVPYYDV